MLHCRRSQSLASVESTPDEALIAEGWIVAGTILSNRDYKPGKHTACSVLQLSAIHHVAVDLCIAVPVLQVLPQLPSQLQDSHSARQRSRGSLLSDHQLSKHSHLSLLPSDKSCCLQAMYTALSMIRYLILTEF